MKISLIHPSRGRARQSFENSTKWLQKAGNASVELIVSVDLSDPAQGEYIKLYAGAVHVFPSTSVVEATNAAAKLATGDILIYLSDDFDCPEGWAELVIKEFENENRPLLLRVDDMLQPKHVPVLTIPMMNRALYDRLGYFWHPWYKSMHVDVDLYHTVTAIGALKNAFHLKFEHKHVSVGKAKDDETYRASAANWNQGLEVFNKRKKMRFSI